MPSPNRDTRQPFTVLLPDGPRKPMEIHDNEVGLAMALVDKASVPALGEDWNSVGAYILLSPVAEDGTYRVYVGKSPAGLRTRLMEHVRSRSWTRALLIRRVVLHGFTSSQAGWLEGDLHDLFSAAERASVENQNIPRDNTVPPYELRMLRSLRDPIVRVVRMLGYETESAPEVIERPSPGVATTTENDATAEVGAPVGRRRRTARTAYNVSIADLLGSGLLTAGERLSSTSNTWPATATLNADATITWNERRYPSASAAASAVCDGTPTNGWDFWAIESGGEATRLSTLRKRHLDAAKRQPTHDPRPWSAPTDEMLAPRSVSLRKAGERKPRTEFNVTVSDLLEAGLLRGGDRLVSTDPGTAAEALVGYDGSIMWNQTSYATPSTAAQTIKGDRNTNGWHFWAVQGADGDVRLDDLRKQHLGIETVKHRMGRTAFYGVELTELMDAGLIMPGDLLVSTSKSWPAVAYVDENANVIYNGTSYAAPSAAAIVVREGRATNGWGFWALERDGTVTRLTDVRDTYLTSEEEGGSNA